MLNSPKSSKYEIRPSDQIWLHSNNELNDDPYDGDYDSEFLKAIGRSLDKQYDPAYFSYDNGKIRRPAIKNNQDKKKIMETLKSFVPDGFTGRVGVYHWEFASLDGVSEVTLEITIEPKSEPYYHSPFRPSLGKGIRELLKHAQ